MCIIQICILHLGVELPRINYIFNGRKYRYAYACCVDKSPVSIKVGKLNVLPFDVNKSVVRTEYLVQIVKLDVETKQQIEWTEEDCFASESVFVPRPNAADEDDG